MNTVRPTSIAIIGGGLGGLTAAAVLFRAGFDVHVYEQARALGEVGAGINISPNASRILNRLGIAGQLERTGVKPATFDQRRWDDGRFLVRAPLGDEVAAAFGAPYYTFHRGDLHRAIADAIPPDRIHLSHRFTHLVAHDDRVEAHFENGNRSQPPHSLARTAFIRSCAMPYLVRKSRASPAASPIAASCRRTG